MGSNLVTGNFFIEILIHDPDVCIVHDLCVWVWVCVCVCVCGCVNTNMDGCSFDR